jgi:predicted dehydrogenase
MSALRTVAILGVGRAGLQHAQAAAAVGLEVCAFTSRTVNSERAQAFAAEFPGARRFNLDDAELCTAADLLVVALPPDVTHDTVPFLAKNGRRLLVEKPLALSTSRIEEIARIAMSSGCKVTVGYNRRLYPAVLRLREVLTSDPPRTAEVTIVEDLDFISRTKGAALTGGYLRHGASTHMLDLSLFLFGQQRITRLHATPARDARGFFDYEVTSTSDRDTLVTTTIDAGNRSRRGIRIVTESGRELRLSPLENLYLGPVLNPSVSGAETMESSFERPTSYVDSFIDQLKLVVKDEVSQLHGVKDSLVLSRFVERLELASRGPEHG